MGRSDLTRYVTTCAGGINQNAEEATRDECADAMNVWAPNGRVVSRPGYRGIATFGPGELDGSGGALVVENPIGTFTAGGTLSALDVAERWYVGFDTLGDFLTLGLGLLLELNDANAASVRATLEYNNGTEWLQLQFVEYDSYNTFGGLIEPLHLAGIGGAVQFYHFVAFAPPQDIALSTVTNGGSRYWFRFTMRALNSGAALTNPTTIVDAGNYLAIVDNDPPFARHRGVPVVIADFGPSWKRYIIWGVLQDSTAVTVINSLNLAGAEAATDVISTATTKLLLEDEPATKAVFPDVGEAFVAYNRFVAVHKKQPASADTLVAGVETGDFAVGTGAPYAKDFVAQRGDFPAAKYLLAHQQRLWYATDSTIGWTPPVPYHKVFPTLSEEPIGGGASKIMGLAALGEQVVVFTEDAIYLMVLRGVNAFGLSEFIPVRRAGVGCVANSSIRQIRGELVFLALDGLYGFDGRNVRKISARDGSDRLGLFFETLSGGRLAHAAGADWKAQAHYLLALPTDGSAFNNKVLAWDYDADRFWIWDNIEAVQWLEDGAQLYFADRYQRIFEFGKGQTDSGAAIESYVVTQRAGYRQRNQIKAREVAVWANNMSREVDIDVLPDDSDTFRAMPCSMRDPVEKDDTALTVDVDKWHLSKQRRKRIGFEISCNHAQVKVLHDQKNKPFELSSIDLGYEVLGAR